MQDRQSGFQQFRCVAAHPKSGKKIAFTFISLGSAGFSAGFCGGPLDSLTGGGCRPGAFVPDDIDIRDFKAEEHTRRIFQNADALFLIHHQNAGIEAALDHLEQQPRIFVPARNDDVVIGFVKRIENEIELIGIDFGAGLVKRPAATDEVNGAVCHPLDRILKANRAEDQLCQAFAAAGTRKPRYASAGRTPIDQNDLGSAVCEHFRQFNRLRRRVDGCGFACNQGPVTRLAGVLIQDPAGKRRHRRDRTGIRNRLVYCSFGHGGHRFARDSSRPQLRFVAIGRAASNIARPWASTINPGVPRSV